MSPMLIFASLAITGALVLYTIGVFKERADGSLRGAPRRLVLDRPGL